MSEKSTNWEIAGGFFNTHLDGRIEGCFIKMDGEFTMEDRGYLNKQAELMHEEIKKRRVRRDPKKIEEAENEKWSLLECFEQPVFVEDVPYEYCHQPCCAHRSWYVVTTKYGRIKIGWRKSVINIDWSDAEIIVDADDLFADENVTKGFGYIHAWSYEKAREYISKLMNRGNT